MTPSAAGRRMLVALVLTVLALAAAASAAAADYPSLVLADQPVAYWRLGELGGLTAVDSSPFHYDAQYLGTAPAPGALYTDPGNGGASLVTTSKIVDSEDWSWLGGAPMGNLPNHAFSLEFWMKPSTIDDRYLWVISEEDKAPVRQGWGVMLTQQPGQPITLTYERWSQGAYVGGVAYKNTNAKLLDAIGVGKWTHVVVTYDGAVEYGGKNAIRLWINGVLVHTTTAQPANMVKITQPFRVGQGDDAPSQPGFIGSVDEVAIYGGAIWDVPQHYKAAFVAPQNTTPPALSGTASRGQTLSASAGTWTGSPAPTVTQQWQRCDTSGTSCAAIAGATGSTYTVADADAGSTLRAASTGTNGGGSVTVQTAATAVIRGIAPANTAAPSISGTGNVGDALTASSGSWSGLPAPTIAFQWQRCNAAGALCSDIPGATGPTYTPTVSDAGGRVLVRAVATNFEGTATALSPSIAVASGGGTTPPATSVPAVQTAPSVSGAAAEGSTLTADPGTWSGSPTSFAYRWQRCATGGACVDVAGATAQTYTAGAADVGSGLAVVVTATNASGSASASSAPTGPVTAAFQPPAAPAATTAPTISGTPTDGATVTADPGTWTGSPTSYAFQWRRCASGGACADVAGAAGTTYALTAADVGSTLVVAVTATGAGGSATAVSGGFGPVGAAAPAATAAPQVAGTPAEGQTLTASTGGWSGTAPLSYGYQWLRCDAAGANCAAVGGQTAAAYTASAADVGSTLAVVVTATNAAGSASATSAPTAKVAATAPSSLAAPAVSGETVDGGTLSATSGDWTGSGPLAFAYQWQRCDTTCAPVAGATGSSYSLTAADVGSTLAVVVTATNAGGSATATSAQTARVAAAPPVSQSAPTVSGTLIEGRTLAAAKGGWGGTAPLSYAYQWKRCASGGACVEIAGATGDSYVLAAADVGSSVTVAVTATNGGGTATAESAPRGPVEPAAPVSQALPVVTGEAVDGGTLSATSGDWTGSGPLAFAYQWQRCDTTCAPVAGATHATYSPNPADVGSTLAVVVTATNAAGSTSATSAPTARVAAAPPVSQAAPTVGGTLVAGQTLTAAKGDWGGTAPLTYAYRWQRCAADGSCVAIDGAAGDAYVLTGDDVGSSVVVAVTATNAGGSATARSAPRGPVAAAPPVATAPPVVSGSAVDGQTLSATSGTWSGTGPFAYTYRWKRCATGGTCADIAGATDATYTLGHADAGQTVAVVVTASSPYASTSATSAAVGPVAALPPVSLTAPAVTGSAVIGQALTASPGTWDGSPPFTYAYQWLACTAVSCKAVPGATAQTYTVRSADYGSSLRVDVTAKSFGVATTASSVETAVVADTVAPTLAISTVATGGVAVAGWNVNLFLTVGVAASDAESGLAADPTCTVDGRAATLKAAGTGAWTVSVLDVGSHTVACAVADKAGNRTTAQTTVKPGGARELEQSLLAQVNRLVASSTRPADADRLRKVAAKLDDALDPANWADSNHLQPSRGTVVFDDNADAAGVLLELWKDKQTQVPQATVTAMVVTIVQVDRVLAASQVASALAVHGKPQKTDGAKDELRRSDAAAAGGDQRAALDHFEQAWQRALEAVR